MKKPEILNWLKNNDPVQLESLYTLADRMRCRHNGNTVHFRGLIEISNYCRRSCSYCGISVFNTQLVHYRMTHKEIMACVRDAVKLQYGTVVLQAGEDPGLSCGFIEDIIKAVKNETSLAVTLSLGERSENELVVWKKAGADRYLLRFETSDRNLFTAIHPPAPGQKAVDRITLLKKLNAIGYETGSGVMVGIPGQTYNSLAEDIITFKKLNLDMIGVGPFLPHPCTPLGKKKYLQKKNQVSNQEEMIYKMIALARLHCPEANIPGTSALATIN
ncbi:MAG TPA: [FeFe] hydrogenase H-cluster radical SAM maturase HydE, partial [Spirochaetia bacterium]|nr:[FeFe] hydrogenase H-cluster radical SAM maturase HydE [Spirochaetia bacterium]